MKSNTNTLKEAINEFLKAYSLSDKLNEHRLISSWEKVMGKMIAKHTTEIFITDKVLTVKLDSSVLREELSFAKTKMIEVLNESIGQEVIKGIILK